MTTGTSGSLYAFTPRAAAFLAVATDVRMYVINNSEVNQTTTTYYLHEGGTATLPLVDWSLDIVTESLKARKLSIMSDKLDICLYCC